jgi:exodeoxyribonuclease V alpha subunit
MPDLAPVERGDFYFVDAADAEKGFRKVLAIVHDRIPQRFGLDPIRDIQVLCPMNRGGPGARSLNIELQNALNPPGEIRRRAAGMLYCRNPRRRYRSRRGIRCKSAPKRDPALI